MSSQPAQTGVARAHCEDCEREYERPLDKAGLSEAQNQEIAARVVRSHAFKCESTGDEWGETATVELNLAGGEP